MLRIDSSSRRNCKIVSIGRAATTLVCATWLCLHVANAETQNPRYQCAVLDLQAIMWINGAQTQAAEEPDQQAMDQEQLREAFDIVLDARALCDRGDIPQAISRYEQAIAQLDTSRRSAHSDRLDGFDRR